MPPEESRGAEGFLDWFRTEVRECRKIRRETDETIVAPKRSERLIWARVIGNKFPHPFWLFVVLSLVPMGLSWWLGRRPVRMHGRQEAPCRPPSPCEPKLSYPAMRVLAGLGVGHLRQLCPWASSCMMLGISLLEHTGMISALMRKTIWAPCGAGGGGAVAAAGINAVTWPPTRGHSRPVIASGAVFRRRRNPWVG